MYLNEYKMYNILGETLVAIVATKQRRWIIAQKLALVGNWVYIYYMGYCSKLSYFNDGQSFITVFFPCTELLRYRITETEWVVRCITRFTVNQV